LPAVGGDGTVYATDRSGRLTALTPAGKRRWSLKLGGTCGTPALGDDGAVYLDCNDGKVYKVAPPS
jgi:outer membrane protein assembly factor BamB